MDLYIVLGIDRSASNPEIRRAYQKLARRYHPDLNPGDAVAAVQFRTISLAYETLSDPERRRQYDAEGLQPLGDPLPTLGFEGFDFSAQGADLASTFGELFGDVLGSRVSPRPSEERGEDLHVSMSLAFDEAMRGGSFSLTLTRRVTCGACDGLGDAPVAARPCEACDGRGHVRAARGHMVFSRSCLYCGGSGRQPPSSCRVCGGEGRASRTEMIPVQVPPGTPDQVQLVIPNAGNMGRRGGAPGDLYVNFHVEPHPYFRRIGDDLLLEVPVGVHEAALGARIQVPTLNGPISVRIPPGTQSGRRFRLRDRGVPLGTLTRRGDLIVEIRIVLPEVLDERLKELLREFGRIQGDDPRKKWAELVSGPATTE